MRRRLVAYLVVVIALATFVVAAEQEGPGPAGRELPLGESATPGAGQGEGRDAEVATAPVTASVAAATCVVPARDRAGQAERALTPTSFPGARVAGERVRIAAVGDVMAHERLQVQAYADPEGFRSTWRAVEARIADADVAYGNLETAVAPGLRLRGVEAEDPGLVHDGVVYDGYPNFNAHPLLVQDLAAAGFDVLSTANNHTMDRGARGARLTLDEIELAGMLATGSRRVGEPSGAWFATTEVGGLRIDWLACTYGLNGWPDPDDQVLHCFDEAERVRRLVEERAARPGVDAVIVTPHWGWEYQFTPARREVEAARSWIEAGATAVLGAHPHVLQPLERYTTRDGRDGLIAYSLGNFISSMMRVECDATVVLTFELVRDACGGVSIGGLQVEPVHMQWAPGGRRLVPSPPGGAHWRVVADVLGEGMMPEAARRSEAGSRAQPEAGGLLVSGESTARGSELESDGRSRRVERILATADRNALQATLAAGGAESAGGEVLVARVDATPAGPSLHYASYSDDGDVPESLIEPLERLRRYMHREVLPAAERERAPDRLPSWHDDRVEMPSGLIASRAPRAVGGPVEVTTWSVVAGPDVWSEVAHVRVVESGAEVLLAVRVPASAGDRTAPATRVRDLASAALRWALEAAPDGPGVQHDWGVRGTVRTTRSVDGRGRVEVVPAADADRYEVWLGPTRVAEGAGPQHFDLRADEFSPGAVIVLQQFLGDRQIGASAWSL